MMTPQQEFEIAEYTAITEHFRAYQTNRLNISVFSAPVLGAIMLHCLSTEQVLTKIASVVILYMLMFVLVNIDTIFMKRLRNYTIRLSEIEKNFTVTGHATNRLNKNNTRTDATTSTIKLIIHALNTLIFGYSLLTLFYCKFENTTACAYCRSTHRLALCTLPLIMSACLFIYTQIRLDVKKLPVT